MVVCRELNVLVNARPRWEFKRLGVRPLKDSLSRKSFEELGDPCGYMFDLIEILTHQTLNFRREWFIECSGQSPSHLAFHARYIDVDLPYPTAVGQSCSDNI